MAAFIVVCVLVSVLARQRPVDCSVLSVYQVYLALLLDTLVLDALGQEECVTEVSQAYLAMSYLALLQDALVLDEQQHQVYLALLRDALVVQDERVADVHQVHLVLLMDALVVDEHQHQVYGPPRRGL